MTAAPYPPPPDAAERQRALDPGRSFIVQAPAGSGKTELLIRRYLALLPTVEDAEEIVAITFTRKAAAEMRERVLDKLGAAGSPLAQNPARLRIQTIDSLCASLTRQMPILSRFGAQPESIDDACELYDEAALATIALVESDGPAAAHIERLLDHLDNDVGRVQALLADMLARRDHWVRHLGRMDRADLEAALVAERERIVAQAASLYPGKAPGGVEAWQALAEDLLTKAGTWRKRSKEAKAYEEEGEAREPLRTMLDTLRTLPPAHYTDAQAEVLEAIGDLLPLAIAQLKLVFQARGQVDFTEVSQRAVLALGDEGEPTDLALALDYRIRHLLIDEFQDTSISQNELVARLTEGWEQGDGRTLFAVGDPMQSIYRFREAEVGLFLDARREGIGTVELHPVELRANFRSQAGIVGWVNATFSRIMPRREDPAAGAVTYRDSAPVHPALGGEAVTVHPFFDKDAAGEAARVVELVRAAHASDAKATVAILVRTRSHLAQIVPQLKAAGLAFRAIDIDPLELRPVVQDLLALTRALSHAADRLAWLSVLRAPWCGLTLADLAALAEGADDCIPDLLQDAARLATLTADGRARLERVGPVLLAGLSGRLRAGLRDTVEAAWMVLGGPACVEDATGLEDAGIFLDHLEAHEAAGVVDAAFEAGLGKLYAQPDLRADDRLQVMTMHKAKGLEFDHVILPGLGRRPRNDDRKLFLWIETARRRKAGLLLAPIQETGAEGDRIYEWLQRLEAAKASLETARLVYVAATRARTRLHLLGDVTTKHGVVRKPQPTTLLGKLWPVVAPAFEAAAAAHAPAVADSEAGGPRALSLTRLVSGWRLPGPPPAVKWGAPADEARVQDAIEFSWAGETARHVGSVVHRWLQRIAGDGLCGWDAARIASMGARFSNELAALGVAPREIDVARDKVAAALSAALDDERGRWLLGPREAAASELRLRAFLDGRLRTLVIDRTFVDAGQRWVVDYKTSGHEGAGLEAFLERERERYSPQLARYAEALGGARRGLYFPMLRGWREWER